MNRYIQNKVKLCQQIASVYFLPLLFLTLCSVPIEHYKDSSGTLLTHCLLEA